ncbi:hypothetical protein HYALB_00002203 [Hymenoscyphus albidus]|uniref:Uncharacterized protein n=1 Tax=Hymenoscyphus albidus TaxID=595503 RepID=A0A9N9Q3Q7_9HELO|nr:hypothetical protein HYALB_00002203 [Hymenoscyphus albidus]
MTCPCSPKSPAHKIHPPLGVTVIFTTPKLLPVLEREWDLAHPQETAGNLPNGKDPIFFRLTAHGDRPIDPTYFDSPSAYTQRARELINENWDPNDKSSFKAKGNQDQGRVTIFTTHGSFMGHTKKSQYQPHPTNRKNGTGVLLLAIALVGFGEFHIFSNSYAGGLGVLFQEPFHNDNPDMRLMLGSGTSLTRGPGSIVNWITDALRRGKWKAIWALHQALRDATRENFNEQTKKWNAAMLNSDRIKKAEEDGEFKAVLLFMKPIIEALVMKFCHDTLFLDGQPVTRLVPRFDWIVKGIHTGDWQLVVKKLHGKSEDSYKAIVDEAKRTWIANCNANGPQWKARNPWKRPAKSGGKMARRHHELQICSSLPACSRVKRRFGDETDRSINPMGYKWTEIEWKELVKEERWRDESEAVYKKRHDDDVLGWLQTHKFEHTLWHSTYRIYNVSVNTNPSFRWHRRSGSNAIFPDLEAITMSHLDFAIAAGGDFERDFKGQGSTAALNSYF